MWTPPERSGRIVLLNGASSSGKSAIATELLRVLPTPWFHLGVDTVGAMRSAERTADLAERDVAEVLARTRAGFHRAVAGLAAAGNDVVADHVLSEPWRLADCLRVFDGIEVVFVGVRCELDELERRERLRGDRPPGTAARQVPLVHAHGRYDLEVDTTRTDAMTCARAIAEHVEDGPRPTAFADLRDERP